jgi:hypothetical protein
MSDISARLIYSLLLSVLALSGASGAEHTLMPSPQTVHVGYFSATLKPVLTVDRVTSSLLSLWQDSTRPS